MKICIAGSRNFKKLELIQEWLYKNFDPEKDSLILGGAEGVDKYAENCAEQNKFKFEIYKAEWDVFGKSAGPIRNLEMVKDSDKVICFWDSESKGTKSTIEFAIRHKKNLEIIFEE